MISLYFIISTKLDCPFPRPPPPTLVHHLLSLLCHIHVFLVGCCVVPSSGGRLRPWRIIFLTVLLIWLVTQKKETSAHMFCPGHGSSLVPLLPLMPTFSWLLCLLIKQRTSKAKSLPISINFCHLIQQPKWTPHVLLGCISPPSLPPLHTQSIGWLLCLPVRRGPPKAGATSLSVFFMGHILASQTR